MTKPIFSDPASLTQQIEELFEGLLTQQQTKVLNQARVHYPHITFDDVLNPNDFPNLMTDPVFNYEEGLQAGIMAAQMAVRARVLRPLRDHESRRSRD